MTEEMKQALDKAAAGLQWSRGQMLIDKVLMKPADPAQVPLERLVCLPVPDLIDSAVHFGANWYRNNVWHDASKETPTYYEDDSHTNQIAVIGNTSEGVGMSVGSLICADTIYSVVTQREYEWGSCPFTKWAYIEDLLPTETENSK